MACVVTAKLAQRANQVACTVFDIHRRNEDMGERLSRQLQFLPPDSYVSLGISLTYVYTKS